ncbi:hypothetical protein B0H12DRAFT_1147787 [Mycena haematopus]|nr:hypothetical protein B0H12DRAFT_1147787 [Mycena haematopus]
MILRCSSHTTYLEDTRRPIIFDGTIVWGWGQSCLCWGIIGWGAAAATHDLRTSRKKYETRLVEAFS